MSKRTLDAFFAPSSTTTKRPRVEESERSVPSTITTTTSTNTSHTPSSLKTTHSTYPWPIHHLPLHIAAELENQVTAQGKEMRGSPDQPYLDLLYFQPFIPRTVAKDFFLFLRAELFFYRVEYTIKRFGKETQIHTPRFTTVFGVDETSRFVSAASGDDGDEHEQEQEQHLVDFSTSSRPIPIHKSKYRCDPRPIPECLDLLRRVTEANTDTKYNFCLVNYYASGNDSISYHSDDEKFLGPDPAIASFTLGARRDFLMKHKPPPPPRDGDGEPKTKTREVRLSLAGGDMVLMRGATQANWLHSIPKRKGGEADRGRINITFRRALVPAGTENYYRYNVGDGGVYRWDDTRGEMKLQA